MARRRSHGKSRRRKKRKSSNRIHSVVIRGPSAFPDRVFVRLRYTNSYNQLFAGLNVRTFSGNALSRPDISSATQLPRGFREWMNIYDLCKCHKSSIMVDCLNMATSTSLDCVVLPYDAQVQPVLVDTEDGREQPYAKSRRAGTRQGNTASVTIRNSMKTKTLYGTKFINDTYAHTLTGAPTNQWDWDIFVQNLVDDSGPVDAEISVRVTYFVELYNRKFIPRSEAPGLEAKTA